jgi:hypothetical protein
MIYKFIDINGSEISVNSISSLQALVDSETIKKQTKVKPGLRGQWTIASNVTELVFPESEYDETEKIKDSEETADTEVDIKSFITNPKNTEDVIEEEDKEDVIEEVIEEEDKEDKEDVIEEEKQNKEKIQTIKDIENLDFEIENKEWIKSKK